MGKVSFSDDFKRDAVAQITERGIRLRRYRSGWVSASIRSTPGRRKFSKPVRRR